MGTAHMGCPVIKGDKWMGQQWVLNGPFEEGTGQGMNDMGRSTSRNGFVSDHYDIL